MKDEGIKDLQVNVGLTLMKDEGVKDLQVNVGLTLMKDESVYLKRKIATGVDNEKGVHASCLHASCIHASCIKFLHASCINFLTIEAVYDTMRLSEMRR